MWFKTFPMVTSVGICCAATFFAQPAVAQISTDTASPKASGFALQTSIVMSTSILDPKTSLWNLSGFEGGMTFGYKFSRGMIGVGFDFTNVGRTETTETFDPMGTPTGTKEVSQSVYSFVVYPQFQIAMAQSADRRAELIADMSLGIGSWGERNSLDTTTDTNETRLRVRWRIGPGVRYWVHPQIGVSLTTGITGNHMIFSGATAADDNSTGITSLYGQFGLLGVF